MKAFVAWFLDKAKAFAGAAVASCTPALIHAAEQTFGFDIPPDMESQITTAVVAGATWLAVYFTKNRYLPR